MPTGVYIRDPALRKPNQGFQKGHNFGKVTRIQKGQKLRQGKTGYKMREERKRFMSMINKGKIPKNLAMINANKFGTGNPMFGTHKSAEWKKNLSDKLAGKMPKNLQEVGQFGNVKRGWYDINGKKMFFRSKWEVNYALYLDFLIEKKQIKSWSYEKDVFIFHKINFGTRSYRPDFKVTDLKDEIVYHEVKGWMDSKSKTKLKRMAKYYPKIRIVIIEREEYYDLVNKIGRMAGFI